MKLHLTTLPDKTGLYLNGSFVIDLSNCILGDWLPNLETGRHLQIDVTKINNYSYLRGR